MSLGGFMSIVEKIIDVVLHFDKYLGVIIGGYGVYTYVFLFIIVFLETALVLTPFLPGDSLLFITGTFAASGLLNIWILFIILTLAAILGDTVNYWIGHYFGEKVFMRSKLFKKEYLDSTHEFYEKHGGKTIVLARFIPIVRTFAPFVAGISEMNYFKFLMYNIFGGILWVGVFLFSGYYFGGIQVVKDNLTLMILGIIFISLIPPIFVLLKRNRDKLKWAVHREYFTLLFICLFSFLAFSLILREVVYNKEIFIDKIVYDSFVSIVNSGLTDVMIFITSIADTLPIFIMSLVLLIVLLIMKRKYSAVIFSASMISGLLLKETIKYVVAKGRPIGMIVESGYGFPSGHTTMGLIFFLLVIYLFKNDVKRGFLRSLFVGFFSLLILAIAFSRLYLGVHWFTDVLGGIFLGIFCTSFFMVIVRVGRHYKRHVRKS